MSVKLRVVEIYISNSRWRSYDSWWT